MKSTDINIIININGNNNKVSLGVPMPKAIVLVILALGILAVLAVCCFYPEKLGLLIRWIIDLFLG